MYAIIACIGSCFAGPRAISQHFFSLRLSISSCDGGLRAEMADFCFPDTALADVYPGGSGKLDAFLVRGGTPSCRASTHFGGVGGGTFSSGNDMAAVSNRIVLSDVQRLEVMGKVGSD